MCVWVGALPGQVFVQTSDFVLVPTQSCPPYCGVGLSHGLITSISPFPQVVEQAPGGPQAPQPPFTERTQRQPQVTRWFTSCMCLHKDPSIHSLNRYPFIHQSSYPPIHVRPPGSWIYPSHARNNSEDEGRQRPSVGDEWTLKLSLRFCEPRSAETPSKLWFATKRHSAGSADQSLKQQHKM